MIKDLKNVCNPKVFETVFNDYAKDVKRFVLFRTKDLSLTEDIVQDTFVKLWEECKGVKINTVKNYLLTIASNLFLNIVRHNHVIDKHQKNYVQEDNIESPEFIFLENEFYDKLQKAIANLSEKQREVFLLSRIEKKKYKEIADQLNISLKAVEKRMHAALLNLKEKIEII